MKLPRIKSFVKRGQILVFLSFLALIVVGTLLLKLPCAMREDFGRLSWLDALFTSTSAACVTGLTSVNTAEFSVFGQTIITILMEVGGIGVITLSTAILLLFGKGLTYDRRKIVSEITDGFSLWGSDRLFIAVVAYTLSCELIGFAIIYSGALLSGHHWLKSIGHSIMLSVAGFCNAGFAPFPDNMTGQPQLCQFGCAFMGILGGLGVCVFHDLWRFISQKCKNFFAPESAVAVKPLYLHTQIMVWGTLVLLFGGMFLLYCTEDDITLFDAFFTSAAARTSGFYCCQIKSDAGKDLIVWLMQVGGGSGGTAGGVKITTVFIAFAGIINSSIGNREVHVFKHTIPQSTVMRAFSLIVYFLTVVWIAIIVLELLYPDVSSDAIYCNVASAISTTGLSAGAVDKFGRFGKLLLCFLMYAGRVGPMTFLLFIFGQEKEKKVNYPIGEVLVG